jgi:hypothetical protein
MRKSPSRQRGKPPWKLNGRPLATHAMPPAKLGSEKADRSSIGALEARRKGRPIEPQSYMTVTATLFLVVAIMHLLRIIFGWHVEVGGLSIPFWVSWLGALVAGALAYFGFTQCR